MSTLTERLDEIEKRREMALKFCSWGNAAPILREDNPALTKALRVAVGALEKPDMCDDTYQENCTACKALTEITKLIGGGENG